MSFSVDVLLVFGYMLFCLGIGLLKYGKIKNIRDYALGSRPFPTVVLLATTFATTISVWKIVGNIGKVYEMGLIYIIPIFCVPISWFIEAKIVAPNLKIFRKHSFISLSDIMEHWYGKTGRWTTNIIAITVTTAVTAASAIAIGYLLHYFINIPETTGMIIGVVVVTIYSVFGGIVAVAFTDVFQFLIFFIALPIACIIGYKDVGSIKNVWSSLPSTHVKINMSDITLFIGFIFFALIPNSDIPYIQRALIAKDKKQFFQSFIGVGILIIPMLAVVCLIGLITYHNNPNIESGKVLYHFIDSYLPVGIKGLMIAGLLAVIMSTQDSYLNTTSVLIAHDICKQIWPSLTSKQELFIARISCVLITTVSILIILTSKGIMEIIWLSGNFSEPLVAIPLMAGFIGTRINKKSFIFVVLSSLTTVTVTRLVTGAFDTRSLAIGMITSAIVLYILHRIQKKQISKIIDIEDL